MQNYIKISLSLLSASAAVLVISAFSNKELPKEENIQYTPPPVEKLTQSIYEKNNTTKLEYLMLSQRSDYQAEQTADDYCFDVSRGKTINDSGAVVKYYRSYEYSSPEYDGGYILEKIRINNEQTLAGEHNGLRQDKNFRWSVKPKMRIRKEDAVPRKNICRVEIYNYDGKLFKSAIITGHQFRDKYTSEYNGEYKDVFNEKLPIDSILTDIAGEFFNPDRRTNGESRMDIKVYWYGTCDLWVDQIRVENDIAGELLSGEYDSWIMEEAASGKYLIADGSSGSGAVRLYRIDTGRTDANNLPGLKYIQEKLSMYSNGKFVFTYMAR